MLWGTINVISCLALALALVPEPSVVAPSSISKCFPVPSWFGCHAGGSGILRGTEVRGRVVSSLRFGHMHGGTVAWAESRRTFVVQVCGGAVARS